MNDRRTIFIALAVSVVLNAGLIGFMAARMTTAPRPPAPFASEAIGDMKLADEELRRAREAMAARRNEYRDQTRELRRAQSRAAELLRARELEEAALREAFEEIRRLHAETERLMQESVIELARDLDPRARERLASYIERQTRMRHSRPPRPDRPPEASRPERLPENPENQ